MGVNNKYVHVDVFTTMNKKKLRMEPIYGKYKVQRIRTKESDSESGYVWQLQGERYWKWSCCTITIDQVLLLQSIRLLQP